MRLALSIFMLACCGVVAQPKYINASHDITQGMVAWWRLDEGTSANSTDTTGNGHTITNFSGPAWTNGPNGSAGLYFSNTYAGVASSALLTNVPQLSISVWIMITGNGVDFPRIVAKRDSASSGYGLLKLDGTNNGIFFTCVTAGTGPTSVQLSRNAWHHIAATFDGSAERIYSDGNLDASTSVSGITTATHILTIGGDTLAPNTSRFDGLIDDVRIYNRALSAAEVYWLAKNGGK